MKKIKNARDIPHQIFITKIPASNITVKLDKTITVFKESKTEKTEANIKADNTEVIEARVRMNERQTCTDAIDALQCYLNLDFCCGSSKF